MEFTGIRGHGTVDRPVHFIAVRTKQNVYVVNGRIRPYRLCIGSACVAEGCSSRVWQAQVPEPPVDRLDYIRFRYGDLCYKRISMISLFASLMPNNVYNSEQIATYIRKYLYGLLTFYTSEI